jgi:hypothetical protein
VRLCVCALLRVGVSCQEVAKTIYKDRVSRRYDVQLVEAQKILLVDQSCFQELAKSMQVRTDDVFFPITASTLPQSARAKKMLPFLESISAHVGSAAYGKTTQSAITQSTTLSKHEEAMTLEGYVRLNKVQARAADFFRHLISNHPGDNKAIHELMLGTQQVASSRTLNHLSQASEQFQSFVISVEASGKLPTANANKNLFLRLMSLREKAAAFVTECLSMMVDSARDTIIDHQLTLDMPSDWKEFMISKPDEAKIEEAYMTDVAKEKCALSADTVAVMEECLCVLKALQEIVPASISEELKDRVYFALL